MGTAAQAGSGYSVGYFFVPGDHGQAASNTAAETPAPEVDPATTADAPVVREAGLYVKLPEKYYLVETSELTVTVKPGEQQLDLALE